MTVLLIAGYAVLCAVGLWALYPSSAFRRGCEGPERCPGPISMEIGYRCASCDERRDWFIVLLLSPLMGLLVVFIGLTVVPTAFWKSYKDVKSGAGQ